MTRVKKVALICAVLLLLAGVAWVQISHFQRMNAQPTPASAADVGGSFTLTDHTGKRVTDVDYAGKYMLVYFGYTFCPDVCPTTLGTIADALDQMGDYADQITPIFISVDVKRDTPDVLAEYVDAFHPKLIGLTGSRAEIDAVVKAYKAYYSIEDETDPEDYAVDHTAMTYLMDPRGRFVTVFSHGTPSETLATQIITALGGRP
ncbi:MAG: SCO family protein [Magnetospiraceae bacterium]